MTEDSEIKEVHVAEPLPDYYDALEGLLTQVHLNQELIQKILKNYIARPQEFEAEPMRMQNYLMALTVRPNVAAYITSRFWAITKNINLDLFQGMMNPSQPNPYAMGGIAYPPTQNTPVSQYPVPLPQVEDADTKMMRMMMMMKMMNQPATPTVDPMQQMMQMMMMSGGRMGVTQQPVMQPNGQPMLDANGHQVMSFTMMPSMQQPMQPTIDGTTELFKEIIKGQNEQKRISDERLYQAQEKQKQFESEMAEKERLALRRRLAQVEDTRSSDRLIEDVERLRKLGLFATGGGNSVNIDAIKLQTDLDKWKIERETDLMRWQQQTELEARKWNKERELEEKREHRTQERLGILGDSLKDTLQTVVTPILSSMSAGVASGIQSAKVPDAPNLASYDDQALLAQYQEVERIGSRAVEAQQMLREEMQRRITAKQSRPSPPVGAVQRDSEQGAAIDLGGLGDLKFGVNRPSEDEDYTGPDELLDVTSEENLDDYDIEY